MLYREYGSTGVTVSALGFGGMRFPEPANIDKMAEIPLAAFRRGVTYFDTAPFYCNDKSETILGVAIQEMKKSGKPFYVSTKTFGADESSIRKDLERSLDRLGVEAIDFYHIWCIKTPENFAERKRRGALEAMLECKAEGLVRHIAVSSHMSGEDTAAMLDEGVFEGVLLGYCAANFPFRETALDAARRKGLAVVTMNPLGGGLIPKHPDRFDFIGASICLVGVTVIIYAPR